MLRDYDDVDLTSDCGIEVHLRVLARWAYIHAATNSQVCIHSYIAIEIRIFFFAMHVHQNQLLKLKRHGIPPLGFAVPFCTCHASSPNCSMLASAALSPRPYPSPTSFAISSYAGLKSNNLIVNARMIRDSIIASSWPMQLRGPLLKGTNAGFADPLSTRKRYGLKLCGSGQ